MLQIPSYFADASLSAFFLFAHRHVNMTVNRGKKINASGDREIR